MSTAAVAMNPFADWLDREIERRNISRAQAAAYMHIRPQTMSAWFVHGAQPSTESCHKIATWAGVDPDFVLRLAGHMAQLPEGFAESDDRILPELLTHLRQMSPEEQRRFALPAIRLAEQLLRETRQ